MAVPKRKTTPSKRGMRRSHDAIKATFGVNCTNCNSIRLPHNACLKCGFYRGKKVL